MNKASKVLMLLSGVLLMAAGVFVIANPNETVMSLAWLMGVFILACGISTFIFWLTAGIRFIVLGQTILFSAIGEILIGCLFLGNNIIVAQALPVIFSVWIIVKGIDIAIHSFDFRVVGFKLWWLLFILGLASAVLGVLSIAKPIVGSITISVFLGCGLILDGLYYIVAVWGINKLERKALKILN